MPRRGTGRVDVYVDDMGNWRWRAMASNGTPTAVSGQSYTRRNDCERAARALFGSSVRRWNLRVEDWTTSRDGETTTMTYLWDVIGGPRLPGRGPGVVI